MSAFIIFLIVVNIGYVLYYAAIITIDMNAKGKHSNDKDLSIDTDGLVEMSNEDDVTSDEESSIPIEQDELDETYDPQYDLSEAEKTNEEIIKSDDINPLDDNTTPENMSFDIVDDNPYGLDDEDENSESMETLQRTYFKSDDDIKTVNNEIEPSSKEPEIRVYESQPSDYAMALNVQGEPIKAESTMPVRPEMMATTLLKAHNIIKQDYINESSQHDEPYEDVSKTHDGTADNVNLDVDNGISYETELFDKI